MHLKRPQRTATTALALLACTTLSSQAVITQVTTSVPVATGGEAFFSDGNISTGADYFGIVDNSGNTIGGVSFSPNFTAPPIGALAGRDHDGEGGSKERTAEWQLSIAGISGAVSPFTNISFSGRIAARDDDNAWDNESAPDFVKFELLQDGVVVSSETKDFRSTAALGLFNGDLALDTNSDGVGDGTVVPNASADPNLAQAFSLTGTTANSTIALRVTAHSDSGNEEYWVDGTLSADVDIVPEPSSSLMLALAGGFFMARRKK